MLILVSRHRLLTEKVVTWFRHTFHIDFGGCS